MSGNADGLRIDSGNGLASACGANTHLAGGHAHSEAIWRSVGISNGAGFEVGASNVGGAERGGEFQARTGFEFYHAVKDVAIIRITFFSIGMYRILSPQVCCERHPTVPAGILG